MYVLPRVLYYHTLLCPQGAVLPVCRLVQPTNCKLCTVAAWCQVLRLVKSCPIYVPAKQIFYNTEHGDYVTCVQVNLHRRCPFWPDDGRCVLRNCQVEECTEVGVTGGVVGCVVIHKVLPVVPIQDEIPGFLKQTEIEVRKFNTLHSSVHMYV